MKSVNDATRDMVWSEVVKQPKITKEELIKLHGLFENAVVELVGYERPSE